MRNLLLGLLAGLLLSFLRVAPGSAVPDLPATGPWSARLGLLLGLGALGAGLTRCSRGLANGGAGPRLLVGVALGFAAHALLLGPWLALESRLPAVLSAAGGALLIAWLAGLGHPEETNPSRAGALELAGVFAAAAGAALGFAALWRPVTLLTLGEPDELRLVALVLLVAAAVGAVAFARLVSPLGRSALPLGLWLAAAACAVGYWALQPLSGNDGLDMFVRSYRLDLSLVGTWRVDALVSARAWIAPGLLAGAGIAGLRGRGPALALLAGLAAGVAASVPLLDQLGAAASPHGALGSPRLLPIALAVASAGGALGLLAPRRAPAGAAAAGAGPGLVARGVAAGVGGLAALGSIALPLDRGATFLSPWRTFVAEPGFLRERAEGVYTLEPAPGGGNVLTLNRRALSATAATGSLEAELLEASLLLVPPERRRGARVLLVGQLDPEREFLLQLFGAGPVDRTAGWHALMDELEQRMLGRKPALEGSILPPDEAFEAVAAGRYDLVLVPPTAGEPPTLPPWEVPAGTAAVAWVPTGGWSADRTWSDRVVVHADPAAGLSVGLLAHAAESPADAPRSLPAGPRVRPPMAASWLALREFDRDARARVATAERLLRGARGTDAEPLVGGLAAHFRAQKVSSPWDSPAQATELGRDTLAALRDAALANVRDWTVRRLWERLGALLVERRDVTEVFEFVEPLADAGEPWPRLDRVVARAELERLEPARAAWRLLRVIEEEPLDLESRILCAEAMLQAEDPAGAVEQLEAVYAAQPRRTDIDRTYAIALARAGDPRARERVEAWLAEHPEDEGLRVYLGAGPFPPIEPSYTPGSNFDDHGDHDHGDEDEHDS